MTHLFKDILKEKGKWSQKRVISFFSFIVATIYGFTPVMFKDFEVKEFVFLGFLGIGGFTIYRIQRPNTDVAKDVTQPTE